MLLHDSYVLRIIPVHVWQRRLREPIGRVILNAMPPFLTFRIPDRRDMPKHKALSGKKSSTTPSTRSPGEFSWKNEIVTVQYNRHGKPIRIVHPPHLTCSLNIEPKPVNRGGRPSGENEVRYVLNRTVGDYIYLGKPKPPPPPVTRYGLTKLAIKWGDEERERVVKSLAPEWDKEISRALIDVRRASIYNFLKRFFKKKGQRLSPNDLNRIFPDLWYNSPTPRNPL